MVDEIFDRTYQSGRAEFNAGLDRGFANQLDDRAHIDASIEIA